MISAFQGKENSYEKKRYESYAVGLYGSRYVDVICSGNGGGS